MGIKAVFFLLLLAVLVFSGMLYIGMHLDGINKDFGDANGIYLSSFSLRECDFKHGNPGTAKLNATIVGGLSSGKINAIAGGTYFPTFSIANKYGFSKDYTIYVELVIYDKSGNVLYKDGRLIQTDKVYNSNENVGEVINEKMRSPKEEQYFNIFKMPQNASKLQVLLKIPRRNNNVLMSLPININGYWNNSVQV